MGNHGLSVNDVDFDGRDEIVYGAMVVDDNGTGLFTTGLRHGDALHVSNFDPSTPDLEVWGIHENEVDVPGYLDGPGVALYHGKTGAVLWGGDYGRDVGRGMAADIDPRHPGAEVWGGSAETGLRTIRGERIGIAPASTNFGIWWDGDLLRELLDGTNIDKWDYLGSQPHRLLAGSAFGAASNNGTKATPCLSADLFGDWREEVIWRNGNNQELMIFTTTIPTRYRFTTLMHDPAYRLAIAWQNVGYNQPPHPSFYLGEGMTNAARKSVGSLFNGPSAGEVAVYPNPAVGFFRVRAGGAFTYRVLDATGREVENGSGRGECTAGRGLAAGLYSVQVHAEGGSRVLKVTKQ
jgi:rhamnogalacturonan endolyase